LESVVVVPPAAPVVVLVPVEPLVVVTEAESDPVALIPELVWEAVAISVAPLAVVERLAVVELVAEPVPEADLVVLDDGTKIPESPWFPFPGLFPSIDDRRRQVLVTGSYVKATHPSSTDIAHSSRHCRKESAAMSGSSGLRGVPCTGIPHCRSNVSPPFDTWPLLLLFSDSQEVCVGPAVPEVVEEPPDVVTVPREVVSEPAVVDALCSLAVVDAASEADVPDSDADADSELDSLDVLPLWDAVVAEAVPSLEVADPDAELEVSEPRVDSVEDPPDVVSEPAVTVELDALEIADSVAEVEDSDTVPDVDASLVSLAVVLCSRTKVELSVKIVSSAVVAVPVEELAAVSDVVSEAEPEVDPILLSLDVVPVCVDTDSLVALSVAEPMDPEAVSDVDSGLVALPVEVVSVEEDSAEALPVEENSEIPEVPEDEVADSEDPVPAELALIVEDSVTVVMASAEVVVSSAEDVDA
jgi:hypothetical protein